MVESFMYMYIIIIMLKEIILIVFFLILFFCEVRKIFVFDVINKYLWIIILLNKIEIYIILEFLKV